MTNRHGAQHHRVRADAYFVLDSRIADVAGAVATDAIAPSEGHAVKQGDVLPDPRPRANHKTPAVIDGESRSYHGAAWQVDARSCAREAV